MVGNPLLDPPSTRCPTCGRFLEPDARRSTAPAAAPPWARFYLLPPVVRLMVAFLISLALWGLIALGVYALEAPGPQ